MGTGDAHHFLIGLGIAGQRLNQYRQRTLSHNRQVELADLVAFGQIGIEIIFAREHRAGRDVCTDREAELDRAFHRPLVQYRQHAGQRDAHRVRLGVRFGTIGGGGTREYFSVGRKLGVHFQPDDDFPLHGHVLNPDSCEHADQEMDDSSVASWYWCATFSILRLGKIIADDLQPDRAAIAAETRRDRHAGQAGQIHRDGVDVGQSTSAPGRRPSRPD